MDYPPILPVQEVIEKHNRFCELEKYFKQKYNQLPKFYVRVPGRVNLIGEHIDYCGFNVLPIGIEQDIVLAVAFNSDQKLNLTNFQFDIYDDFSMPMNSLIVSDTSPKWYDYFICGIKGIADTHLYVEKGLDVAVHGTIPASSGLSSSSALVCAAALATAYANGIFLPKVEIASICAKAEHYIGTQGGGMDQAIAFLAERGSAKLIKFNPLEAINVPLPAGANFVVANCCVPMNKAATADFNIRVVECRISAKILAKFCNMDWKNVSKLNEIPKKLNKSLEIMSSEVRKLFHPEPYSRTEVCTLLGISDNEFASFCLSHNTQDLQEFKLFDRACHVYDEALRVEQFKNTCENCTPEALTNLGKLMSDSHASCRDLYECSHPELDELVDISIAAGALGSRLTGAGWGGCSVSLVLNKDLDNFMHSLKKEFYEKSPMRRSSIKTSLFATKPGVGAVIYTA